MLTSIQEQNVTELVEKLNFAEKVDRSIDLIAEAYEELMRKLR